MKRKLIALVQICRKGSGERMRSQLPFASAYIETTKGGNECLQHNNERLVDKDAFPSYFSI